MHLARAKASLETEPPAEIAWIERCRPLHFRSLATAD
jgi:hypothetical protein